MNRYQGLNLPQLLDLMEPLVEPVHVPFWPQTSGWKILLAWFLVLLVMICARTFSSWRHNRYRREALRELTAIAKSADDNPGATGAAIAGLLKRTALTVFPREQVAGLYGRAWADFLADTTDGDRLVRSKASELAGAAYRNDVNGAALIEAARRWIEGHRV